jgi:hypothetical protein
MQSDSLDADDDNPDELLEDAALMKSMEEGRASGWVTRDEVMALLDSVESIWPRTDKE